MNRSVSTTSHGLFPTEMIRQSMPRLRLFFFFGTLLLGATAAWHSTASAAVLKIMPLGDSITEGPVGGAYRLPLYNLLTAAGYRVQFVGSQTSSPGSLTGIIIGAVISSTHMYSRTSQEWTHR